MLLLKLSGTSQANFPQSISSAFIPNSFSLSQFFVQLSDHLMNQNASRSQTLPVDQSKQKFQILTSWRTLSGHDCELGSVTSISQPSVHWPNLFHIFLIPSWSVHVRSWSTFHSLLCLLFCFCWTYIKKNYYILGQKDQIYSCGIWLILAS